MKKFLEKLIPENKNKRKFFAVITTLFFAGIFTVWGIYGIGKYGIALFILTPFLIGFLPASILGYKENITKNQAYSVSFITLLISICLLLIFAIEGLICIIMALPLLFLMVWLGSWLGYLISTKKPNSSPTAMMIFILIIPTMSFIEKDSKPNISKVTTSIIINASPEKVWKNVIEFPQLKEPEEFIFKTGIAYPINAKINGSGVGAIRYCNFTTGSFVEPITIWNEPNLLQFSVKEQPEPMKELSFWDVNAPHLHDYFVSKKGQFKLITLKNGKTKLEGTTWYYHNIYPEFYWRPWSNYIIHQIHNRVLNHIKQNCES